MTGKADSVFAMSSGYGSFIRSLSEGPAGASEPLARSLTAAMGALPRHKMTALKTACLTISRPPESHRFRAEVAHLRAPARPKGPFYCRELALLGPSCETKALHIDHFRGRQQGRISALNCTKSVGIASAGLRLAIGRAARIAA